jgi:phosphoglycolate phosphatase
MSSGSSAQRKLLLFDIDGTLIDTGGAGLGALRDAFIESFGLAERASEMPKLDLAGSTDSGIVRSLCAHFGLDSDAETVRTEAFYQNYLKRLRANLNDSHRDEGRVLPGLPSLIEVLRDQTTHVLGLLTGNIARGAWLKVEHFGFADVFAFGAFGDDHHDRNRLGPIAVQRATEQMGMEFEANDVCVIGDTPKDIACARACGAVAVAVATGRFSSAELEAHAPDHLFDTFADHQAVIGQLGLQPAL